MSTRKGFHELPEGEFHATGDLGYLDERGRLFLAGRAHDVMKTGGYKIYPEEIERVLPSGMVVVGIPSAHWGEVIVAVSEDGADHHGRRSRPRPRVSRATSIRARVSPSRRFRAACRARCNAPACARWCSRVTR